MKTISVLSLMMTGAAVAAFAVEPSAALFENDQVKVSRALEKAHVKGGFHEHKTNRVMVYLQSGRQRFEYQDGRKPAVFDWKAGQVVWSAPEGMHSPEVTGDEPFNIVEVELKKPGTPKTVPPVRDRRVKTELENDQVRVLRVTLAAHEKISVPHPGNCVEIFLSAQDSKHKPGDAVWQTAGTSNEEAGDSPLELVLVELKS